jgi:ribonuclease P protein component
VSEAGRPDESRSDARLYPFRRLIKRRDFLAAASGRRFHSERMTVQGRLRDDGITGMRVGFTLTKRVGNAVERNRIKRRLRAAIRQFGSAGADAAAPRPKDADAHPAPISPAPAGQSERDRPAAEAQHPDWPVLAADIVVVGRRPAIDAPFKALVADIARALPKVTKPGDPDKRGRGRDARMRSTHRRRGRGESGTKPGPAPSGNS